MMHQFNKTIDYLESTLTSEVELKKFQNISGYSYPLFSRIFSILSEITLAEYLRNRKLTLAVDDLLNTDQKVIDIALKYNYDSSDAFSFSFKKFHGNSPSEVRKGKNYPHHHPAGPHIRGSGRRTLGLALLSGLRDAAGRGHVHLPGLPVGPPGGEREGTHGTRTVP